MPRLDAPFIKSLPPLSGHLTLAEVERYTRAADQVRLAKDAMATMVDAFPSDIRKNVDWQAGCVGLAFCSLKY